MCPVSALATEAGPGVAAVRERRRGVPADREDACCVRFPLGATVCVVVAGVDVGAGAGADCAGVTLAATGVAGVDTVGAVATGEPADGEEVPDDEFVGVVVVVVGDDVVPLEPVVPLEAEELAAVAVCPVPPVEPQAELWWVAAAVFDPPWLFPLAPQATRPGVLMVEP